MGVRARAVLSSVALSESWFRLQRRGCGGQSCLLPWALSRPVLSRFSFSSGFFTALTSPGFSLVSLLPLAFMWKPVRESCCRPITSADL